MALFPHALKPQKGFSRRAVSAVLALVTVASSLVLVATPVSAGTLMSPTWTVMDPRTNIQGNRYDYNFTTATAGTVNRVTATVPAGTSGSNRYLVLNGTGANYANTPNASSNTITGDLDLRIKLAPSTWAPGSYYAALGKWGGSTSRSYELIVNAGGTLSLAWSPDGSTQLSSISTVATGFTSNTAHWIRGTLQVNNGSSGNTVTFYTSSDGTNWTVLGAPIVTSGTTSIGTTSTDLEIGARSGGAGFPGKIYYSDVRSGISGTTTSPSTCASVGSTGQCFDPSNDTVGGTSWASTDATGETWTVNRSGTNAPADIASDLSVMNISGLPSGGTAQLREIDGVASYTLPTATAIAAATPVKLGLAGMTNTYTAGSYASTVATLDSSSTTLDSAPTSNSVAFTVPTIATASASPPVLSAATTATNVDMMPNSIGISGTKVYYSDFYASTANYVDTSTGMATRLAGLGYQGATNAATALLSTLTQPTGMVQDSAGNIYVADQTGTVIRKITGTTMTTLVSSGLGTVQGMAIDASDNIYIADSSKHVIFKMTTAGALTVVAGTSGTAGATLNSTATASYLNTPCDVALSSDGTLLYIADTSNNRVLQVVLSTGAISVFAGGGATYADGGSATATSINGPRGVAVDTSGNVYISDAGNNRIRKVVSGVINTIGGNGTAGATGDGGVATSATVSNPRAIRLDASGNIYFVDWYNQRIREISGTTMTTFAGTGKSSWVGDGGPLSGARFYKPGQMHADNNGNLYVADNGNNAIRKINQYGVVTTVGGLGPMVASDSGDGGPATAAGIQTPRDVIPDGSGNLYIAEPNTTRIRKIDSSGNISTFMTGIQAYDIAFSPDFSTLYAATGCQVLAVNIAAVTKTVFAGNGTCGTTSTGDFGPATSAGFFYTRGIAVDNSGNVYVADWANGNIRRIDSSGIIRTIGGSTSGSYTDGVANISRRDSSEDYMNFDGANNLYVQGNGRATKFGANGIAVSAAINGGGAPAGDGGAATAASMVTISGIAFNLGSLYMADLAAMTIRVVANQAPVAPLVDADTMTVPMNTARSWPILSNDWSRSNEMDPSSVTITSTPAHGTVTLTVPSTEASTLQANFTPTAAYTGTDSFTYQACDTTKVLSASAAVTVNITTNAVTTVAGGVAEGYATSIGFNPASISQYRNYLIIGDSQFTTVRRLDLYSGQMTVLAGIGSNSASSAEGVVANTSPLAGTPYVTTAPDGTIYIGESSGNRVRQISTAGLLNTVVGTGTSGNGADGSAATSTAISGPSAVAVGPDGRVYFTSGSMVRVATIGGTVTTVAGTGTAGSTVGATAVLSQLNGPRSIAVTSNGTVFIADQSNCAIRQVVGTTISTVAGTLGTCGFGTNNVAATSTAIASPNALTVDSTGAVIFSDTSYSRLQRFTVGGTISIIANNGSSYVSGATAANFSLSSVYGLAPMPSGGYWETTNSTHLVAGVNGVTTAAIVTVQAGVTNATSNSISYSGDGALGYETQFSLGTSGAIATDSAGNIYFSDTGAARIRKLDLTTGLISTYAGDGTGTQFNGLHGQIAFGPAGQLVFSDNTCRIRSRDTSGTITTLLGNGTCAFAGDGGLATAATMSSGDGLAFNAAGDLYVSSTSDSRIRRIDHSTGIITTVAGTGTSGYTGDSGLATAATLSSPTTMAFDSAGNLYVTDSGNSALRMIDKSGYITTLMANNGVKGIVVDPSGRVFVSNTNCNVMYKLTAGVATAVAGACAYGFKDNTTAGSAIFYGPSGLAISGSDLYVYDPGNSRIRKVSGVIGTAPSSINSASWTAAPAAVGHANLREQFSITPASTTTSSKFTVSVPSGFTLSSPTVVGKYGVTGTVTPSLSGTTLTLSYPSQTLTAGVPVAIGLEGVTSVGAVGNLSSFVQLYDSAGTTVIGTIQSNVLNNSSIAGPSSTDPGYASIWQRSLTATPSAASNVNVNPAGTTDATGAFTVTNGGVLNANTLSLSATSMTGNGKTIASSTLNSTTSVASASFAANTWGLQLTSSTGTNGGATGSGLYSGLATTPASVLTGGSAANVFTVTPRAKVNYLTAAGTYQSSLTWAFTPGT